MLNRLVLYLSSNQISANFSFQLNLKYSHDTCPIKYLLLLINYGPALTLCKLTHIVRLCSYKSKGDVMRSTVLFLLVFSAVAAFAANDLLILHCEGGASLNNCQANFDPNPYYGSVDYLDGSVALVPLTTLQNYTCVLTWNNHQYLAGQGDILADYVDGGGKVVILGWALFQCYGRILDDPAYCPLVGGSNQYSPVDLGTTYAHDILDGVSSITGIAYWVTASLEPGATLIADNTGGSSLVAINAGNSVVAVNFVAGDYISWTSDGWILLNNAVEYLMGATSLQRSSWGSIKTSF